MPIPDCFIPTGDAAHILARVHEGLTVDQADASLLVRLGLLQVLDSPSAGSGFVLTEDGSEALSRYIYTNVGSMSVFVDTLILLNEDDPVSSPNAATEVIAAWDTWLNWLNRAGIQLQGHAPLAQAMERLRAETESN